MDKVLFLLCIPEEDEDTQGVSKDKENETESTMDIKSQEFGDKGQECAKATWCTADLDSEKQLRTVPNSDAAATVSEGDATGSWLLQVEKQKEMGLKQMAPHSLPLLTTAVPANAYASAESKRKERDAFQDSSVDITVGPFYTSADMKMESPKSGREKPADETVNIRQTLPVAAYVLDRLLKSDGTYESFDDTPLITRDMIGKKLTDDFWDFDVPGSAEASKLQHSAQKDGGQEKRQHNPDNKDTQDVQAPEGNQTQTDQDRVKLVEGDKKTDAPDEFVTCPNTPEVLNKVQSKEPSSDSQPATPPSEFSSPPSLSESSDSSCSMPEEAEDKPARNGAASCEKTPQISGKFIAIPVEEGTSPAKSMIKSASTGGMKMTDSEVDLPVEDQNNEQKATRKLSLPTLKKAPITDPDSIAVDEKTELMDFLPKVSLRTLVRNCLSDLGVKNVAWQKCTGDRVWQVTFIEDAGMRCENIMLKLAAIGVARVQKSTMSVIPVSIHAEKEASKDAESLQVNAEHDSTEEKVLQMEEKANEFQKSIKSRLVVRQVVKSVESNAEFTFDYCMLIILASIIAVLGLVESSPVVLVASMLISPLMGPILAGTFGIVIKNDSLRNLGIRSELFGLGICLICGFVCGLVPAGLEAGSLHWRNSHEWPTLEMSSRGEARGLVLGMMIALPSGMGVALSVLGGNIGSLVGVAISASLLPPAVNAGVLWSSALVAALSQQQLLMQKETRNVSEIINGTMVTRQETVMTPILSTNTDGPVCPQIKNNEYVHIYVCNTAADFMILGTISLLLTILNIFCIFVAGVAVLKIKEVAPRTSTQLDQNFFKKDIQIARESYTTAKGPQSAMMGKKWLEEYKSLKRQLELGDIAEEENDTIEFQHILQSAENSPEVRKVLGRVSNLNLRPMSEEMAPQFEEAAVRCLEKNPELDPAYHTLSHPLGCMSPHPVLRHNAYHTVRSAWNLFPSSPTPFFVFPQSYHFRPDHVPSTPKFFAPSRLAPIAEGKDGESGGSGGPTKRTPRLYIPKHFYVTRLEEKDGKVEETSKEHLSDQPASENEPSGRDIQEHLSDQPASENEPSGRDIQEHLSDQPASENEPSGRDTQGKKPARSSGKRSRFGPKRKGSSKKPKAGAVEDIIVERPLLETDSENRA